MVYKNFFLRSVFSFLFIIIYLIISFINFSYFFYVIFFIYALIIFEIFIYFKKNKLFPILYILISFVFFLMIEFRNFEFKVFNLFIFSIIMFDTFSYLTGKILGKNQLIKISPNKTIEGFVGGFILSFVLSILFSYFLKININLYLFLFIILIILTGFVGDIIQSYFKRINHLKNSSEFIPGHGGVFDRFDSFLFSIIFYSISINFLL